MSHSWLCDPDGLLSYTEQAKIEAELMKFRDNHFHYCNNQGPFIIQVI